MQDMCLCMNMLGLCINLHIELFSFNVQGLSILLCLLSI